MATHHFEPVHYHTTLGSHDPVLRIAPGDTVITTTADAMGRDDRDVQVTAEPNPQTGPFYVEGAAAGDVLVLRLDRLVPNRATGESDVMPAPNVVDPDSIPSMPRASCREGRKDIRWRIDQEAGMATLIEPEGKLGQLSLPLAPMLGCCGVAPPGGQAILTMTSGQHGGNIDYRGFVSGVTVYFPVFVPGACCLSATDMRYKETGKFRVPGSKPPLRCSSR